MERKAARDMFSRSENHGLIYEVMVSDGDSKAYIDVFDVYGFCKDYIEAEVHECSGSRLHRFVLLSILHLTNVRDPGFTGPFYYQYYISRMFGIQASQVRSTINITSRECSGSRLHRSVLLSILHLTNVWDPGFTGSFYYQYYISRMFGIQASQVRSTINITSHECSGSRLHRFYPLSILHLANVRDPGFTGPFYYQYYISRMFGIQASQVRSTINITSRECSGSRLHRSVLLSILHLTNVRDPGFTGSFYYQYYISRMFGIQASQVRSTINITSRECSGSRLHRSVLLSILHLTNVRDPGFTGSFYYQYYISRMFGIQASQVRSTINITSHECSGSRLHRFVLLSILHLANVRDPGFTGSFYYQYYISRMFGIQASQVRSTINITSHECSGSRLHRFVLLSILHLTNVRDPGFTGSTHYQYYISRMFGIQASQVRSTINITSHECSGSRLHRSVLLSILHLTNVRDPGFTGSFYYQYYISRMFGIQASQVRSTINITSHECSGSRLHRFVLLSILHLANVWDPGFTGSFYYQYYISRMFGIQASQVLPTINITSHEREDST